MTINIFFVTSDQFALNLRKYLARTLFTKKICTQYIEGQKSENKVKTRNLNKDQKQFVRIQFEPPLC